MKQDDEYVLLYGDFNSHTGMLDELVEIEFAHQIDEKEEIVLDTKDIIEKKWRQSRVDQF